VTAQVTRILVDSLDEFRKFLRAGWSLAQSVRALPIEVRVAGGPLLAVDISHAATREPGRTGSGGLRPGPCRSDSGRGRSHSGHRVRLVAFGSTHRDGPMRYSVVQLGQVTAWLESYIDQSWALVSQAHPGEGAPRGRRQRMVDRIREVDER
jgi:hypothetical protein